MRRCQGTVFLAGVALAMGFLRAAEPALVLIDGGIRFPDGTVQETSGVLADGPPTLTVTVDCNNGGSINAALKTPADQLTVAISGICREDVEIRRSNVTLRGTNPDFDGIASIGVAPFDRPLQVFATYNVTIENLSISGGTVGLGVNSSFSVEVVNCRLTDHLVGAIVGTGGALQLVDTTVTGNRLYGLAGFAASVITCSNCTVQDNGADGLGTGIELRQGSELVLDQSTVEGRRAVRVRGGSRVYATGSASVIRSLPNANGNGAAILAIGNVSVELYDAALIGPVDLQQKSVATLTDVTQMMPETFTSSNSLTGDSAIRLRGGASLAGDLSLSEFSSGYFSTSASLLGNLSCSSGADVHCDDAAVIGGASDCSRCPTE